jgi:hypothetical protein
LRSARRFGAAISALIAPNSKLKSRFLCMRRVSGKVLHRVGQLRHQPWSMPINHVGTPAAAVSPKISSATRIGLFLALFPLLIARQTVSHFSPTLTFTAALWKESLIWLSAIALLIVIRRGERLPLSSVGIGTSTWRKSVLWGILLAVICAVVGALLAALTHYGHGPGAAAFEKLPLWLIALIVLRAGVVEEFFYRGYAIERLQTLGLNRYWAAVFPWSFSRSAIGLAARPTSSSHSCSAASLPDFISGAAIWSRT